MVLGYGGNKAIFVGEAPGEEEDWKGRPFVGKSGRLARRGLNNLGFSHKSGFFMNTVLCRPPRNRNPTADEIKACRFRDRLYLAVKLNDCNTVICLGKVAFSAVVNDRDMFETLWRMEKCKYRMKLRDITVFVGKTKHPAYYLRQPDSQKSFESDMYKTLNFLGLLQ